jgi:predicted ArsR family transcriptional regulator
MTGDQMPLAFDPARHQRRSDPNTSAAAARSVRESAPVITRRLLDVLRARGPLTRTEVALAAGITEYQASKRLSDLKNADEILDSGERRVGPSGREQIVWAARRIDP